MVQTVLACASPHYHSERGTRADFVRIGFWFGSCVNVRARVKMYNNQTTAEKPNRMQLKRTIDRTTQTERTNETKRAKLNTYTRREFVADSRDCAGECALDLFSSLLLFFPDFLSASVRSTHVILSARTPCLHSPIVVKLLLFLLLLFFQIGVRRCARRRFYFITLFQRVLCLACAPARARSVRSNERTNERREDETRNGSRSKAATALPRTGFS